MRWIAIMGLTAWLSSFAGASQAFAGGVPLQASGSEPVAARKHQYDAAEGGTRRRTPAINTQSEDELLDPAKRAKVQANAKDLCRNFSIAGWAIRRHLDYVSTFDFHAGTEDDGLNTALEEFVWERAKAFNFDVAGRHCWESSIRMLESQTAQQGDNGLMMLADGRFQGIESDRVRTSGEVRQISGKWVHGIQTDAAGRSLNYAVHQRTLGGGFKLERLVPARNMLWHGYYDRWDQVRGISPIVSGLNQLRDVYENFDYALAKAKVSQLFALKLTRNAAEAAGAISGGIDGEGEEDKSDYKVDFGKGPIILDMDPGDEAAFMESQHPSTQFQDFTQLVIMVALKALDIPYSFYDEAHTNFFGSRGSWLHYERSCLIKRRALSSIQDRMLIRLLQIAIVNGEFSLPRSTTIFDLDWEFVPRGMPWWKPSDEINGDVQAIGAGLDNPERICRARGTGDVYDNIKRTAKVIKFAAANGVPLSFSPTAYKIEVAEHAGK